jgi:hypothetical protein
MAWHPWPAILIHQFRRRCQSKLVVDAYSPILTVRRRFDILGVLK